MHLQNSTRCIAAAIQFANNTKVVTIAQFFNIVHEWGLLLCNAVRSLLFAVCCLPSPLPPRFQVRGSPVHSSNHTVFNKNRVVPTPLGISCTVGRYTS